MSGMIATFTALLLLPAPQLDAQAPQPTSIRQSLAAMDFGAQDPAQAPAPKRKRPIARSIAGGVLGAVGGFIVGTYTVGLLIPDCEKCEPPPLPQGLIVGGPLGALVGSILGAKYM